MTLLNVKIVRAIVLGAFLLSMYAPLAVMACTPNVPPGTWLCHCDSDCACVCVEL
jgi:hypothetical protein